MLRKQLLFFFLLFSLNIFSQVGISTSYTQMKSPDWNANYSNGTITSTFPHSGVMIGLDYWFRLRTKRIEFLPTFYYKKTEASELNIDMTNYGFQANTNFYVLDFGDDCNCPTFSKQNETLKKGLFIQLSPEIGFWNLKMNTEIPPSMAMPELRNELQLSLGAGLGLDIGISHLITLTPSIKFRHTFPLDWSELEEVSMYKNSSSDIQAVEYTLRVGLRFDKRNYGYRRSRR